MHTRTEAGTAGDKRVTPQVGSLRGVSFADGRMLRNVIGAVPSSHSQRQLAARRSDWLETHESSRDPLQLA
jgi:hypothetical protein